MDRRPHPSSHLAGPGGLGPLARTAASRAQVATVRWASGGDQRTATARVHVDGNGCLLVLLDDRSALVEGLGAHPVLTVVVAAPAPWTSLALEGVAHRVPVARGATYRVSPSRLVLHGASSEPVAPADYFAADPAPSWVCAPAVVDHLARTRGTDLTRFLRTHGVPCAQAVVPVALTPDGLEVGVLTADGVAALRLRLPRTATGLGDALEQLTTLLGCDGC